MLPVDPKIAMPRCVLIAITPEPNRPRAYRGAAAVTLSRRSSSPPCPGSNAPLSLSAAARLNMLSVRSPMMENMPTAQPNAIAPSCGKSKYSAPPQATSAAISTPPTAPSQVFPGLMRGASLRRPKLRPAKYAPISAAIPSAPAITRSAHRLESHGQISAFSPARESRHQHGQAAEQHQGGPLLGRRQNEPQKCNQPPARRPP